MGRKSSCRWMTVPASVNRRRQGDCASAATGRDAAAVAGGNQVGCTGEVQELVDWWWVPPATEIGSRAAEPRGGRHLQQNGIPTRNLAGFDPGINATQSPSGKGSLPLASSERSAMRSPTTRQRERKRRGSWSSTAGAMATAIVPARPASHPFGIGDVAIAKPADNNTVKAVAPRNTTTPRDGQGP